MPKPTLQNRRYFKEFLKRYRDKFTSRIQNCQVDDISAMFSQSIAGLSTTANVNLLLVSGQKYDDTIDIDFISDGSLIYFPANSGDYINVGLNSLRYQLYFSSEDGGITFDNTTYGLNDTFDIGTKSFTVKALGGALVESNDGPVYSLSSLNSLGISTNLVYEGDSVNFVIETQNVSAGSTLYFTTAGIATHADFTDNSLTGSFNVIGTGATTGIATLVRTLVRDSINEYPDEDFKIQIRTSSITGSIVAESNLIYIKHSDPPTYTVGVSTTNINEGESVVFTVNSYNAVGIGTLYFTTSGTVSAEDFVDSSLIGSFNIVSTGATTGIATITRTITNDLVTEGTETFNLEIRAGSASTISGTLVATSSTVYVSNAPIPTFDVGISTTTINEGDAVEFTVNTTGFSTSIPLYYSTGGSVTASDFTDSSLTGSFNLVSTGATTGVATITRTLAYDFESGAADTFNLSIRTGSTSGTVVATSSTITVNNLTPLFEVIPSTTSVNEGGSVVFTINTVNVASGTRLYYSINGTVSSADFSNPSLTGGFDIVGTGATTGIATITRTLVKDLSFDEAETFIFNVRTISNSGPIVASSPTITVNNIVPTFSVVPSTSVVNEGSTVSFTITTTDVANGTLLYWTILQTSGVVSASDFSDAAISGSFAINNNTGTVNRTIASDRSTEGLEAFKIEIRSFSTSGDVVATSSAVTINDTSLNVGQNANGLTFGPIQVNRDGENGGIVSDWYSICGIDNLPEGSSIALFIDTSGSMTQATIQASYNLLVQKLNEKNITITAVTNPNEDWITPFLVDLP